MSLKVSFINTATEKFVKMRLDLIEKTIKIPEGVESNLDGNILKIKGPKGEVQRTIKAPKVDISIKENTIRLQAKKATRKEKMLIGTFTAHINNLIKGAQEGFLYKLKICSGHFPMQVVISGNEVIINNFLGEKIPRKSLIFEGVDVKIDNDIITVEGIDIEKTAQTAANIEQATRIRNKDRRVFQDGCYLISKGNKEI